MRQEEADRVKKRRLELIRENNKLEGEFWQLKDACDKMKQQANHGAEQTHSAACRIF